jgi:hypothetical protein
MRQPGPVSHLVTISSRITLRGWLAVAVLNALQTTCHHRSTAHISAAHGCCSCKDASSSPPDLALLPYKDIALTVGGREGRML